MHVCPGQGCFFVLLKTLKEDRMKVNTNLLINNKQKNMKNKNEEKSEKIKTDLMIDNMLNGFALHKVITDEKGVAVDYVFLRVNSAFEKLTGLKKENIINKKVTEVIPGIEKNEADWIAKYGKVALTGESIKFENYSDELKKWYDISAYSPQKGYFVAIFNDITEIKQSEEALEKKVQIKTEELNKKIKELEGINKFMVERELKMIEMKEEIKKLKEKLESC
jgi:PAS domain S-box-containing protein